MAPKDIPSPPDEVEVIKKKAPEPEAPGEHPHRKRRKHGYRGYPNNPEIGGGVHTGSGFAGVGSTAGGPTPSGSGIIGEKTQESVEEIAEEEEE
ncbi:MAG TPA: hypothetical protein VGH97_06495 [Thermoanaerobaculia bacterium]